VIEKISDSASQTQS